MTARAGGRSASCTFVRPLPPGVDGNGPSVGIAFVETTIFTRKVNQLGLEQGLRDLQLQLTDNPESGRLDTGTGGLRKVRMADASRGKGKRSGVEEERGVAVFASFLNVSTKLVQAWESDRRAPEGAALKLWRLAEETPGLVLVEAHESIDVSEQ